MRSLVPRIECRTCRATPIARKAGVAVVARPGAFSNEVDTGYSRLLSGRRPVREKKTRQTKELALSAIHRSEWRSSVEECGRLRLKKRPEPPSARNAKNAVFSSSVVVVSPLQASETLRPVWQRRLRAKKIHAGPIKKCDRARPQLQGFRPAASGLVVHSPTMKQV